MAKKKAPRKKSGRGPAPLPPELEGPLRRLLEAPGRSGNTETIKSFREPRLAAAFLENLPASDTSLVPILTEIRDAFDHRAVKKAARRAAFRFEQRGIFVPAPPGTDEAALRPVAGEKDKPFAFLTSFDGLGARGVVLGVPAPAGGIDMGFAFASDEEGILHFAGGSLGRKRALAAKDDFLDRFQHIIPASPEHAATVLERAHRARPDGPGSAEYLEMRPWILDRFKLLESPPVYGHIPLSEVKGRPFTATMAARLLEHEVLADWLIAPVPARSLAEKIHEVREGRIYLTEDQQTRRGEDLKLQWIREYFDQAARERMRTRLEETAYLLLLRDDQESASLACTAALSLTEGEPGLEEHPFLLVLTEKILDLFLNGDPGQSEEHAAPADAYEETSGGIIIP
jgi:hypothetical protein